jgi:copper chaperone CopZ
MTSNALTLSTTTTGYRLAIVQLKDLHCQGCADNIRGMIWNCDGVESVNADVRTRQVTVEFTTPFSEEILVRKLQLAMFELAEPVVPQIELVETPSQEAISA